MIDVDYNEYKETLSENIKLIVENNRLKEVEKEHQKLNGELREEIERLNNIISEFESWLIGWIENEQYCFMSNNPKDRCRREVYEEVLHHFKELKGSDKE